LPRRRLWVMYGRRRGCKGNLKIDEAANGHSDGQCGS
jgi:hypothetical protein